MFLIDFIANGGSSSNAYGVLDFCVVKNCWKPLWKRCEFLWLRKIGMHPILLEFWSVKDGNIHEAQSKSLLRDERQRRLDLLVELFFETPRHKGAEVELCRCKRIAWDGDVIREDGVNQIYLVYVRAVTVHEAMEPSVPLPISKDSPHVVRGAPWNWEGPAASRPLQCINADEWRKTGSRCKAEEGNLSTQEKRVTVNPTLEMANYGLRV